MISVAMCTYNGSKYLAEQLSSIGAQTRLPDELVICDDRSTDDTVLRLKQFAKAAPFPVRIFENTDNCGSTRSFEKTIRYCQGDIICLSDQDDAWLPWRLQDTEAALASDPTVAFVFGDGYIVDDQGIDTGHTLWEAFEFTPIQRFQVKHGFATRALLRRPAATGATVGFRSWIRERCLPIPSVWPHDAWLALISSCICRFGLLPRPVIRYRRHADQQIGATYLNVVGKLNRQRVLGIDKYEQIIAQLEAAYEKISSIDDMADLSKLVSAKMEHLRRRNSLPAERYKRLRAVLEELLSMRYTLYSTGILGALRDLSVRAKQE